MLFHQVRRLGKFECEMRSRITKFVPRAKPSFWACSRRPFRAEIRGASVDEQKFLYCRFRCLCRQRLDPILQECDGGLHVKCSRCVTRETYSDGISRICLNKGEMSTPLMALTEWAHGSSPSTSVQAPSQPFIQCNPCSIQSRPHSFRAAHHKSLAVRVT